VSSTTPPRRREGRRCASRAPRGARRRAERSEPATRPPEEKAPAKDWDRGLLVGRVGLRGQLPADGTTCSADVAGLFPPSDASETGGVSHQAASSQRTASA